MIARNQIKSYDGISRFLHWAIALLVIWQLGGMLTAALSPKRAWIETWTSTHSSVGALILTLAIIRVLWAISGFSRRPSRVGGPLGMAARWAHGAMYAALILLPSMALLRSIGSGRGVALFGLEFLAPTGQKIPALMAPANAVHGLFGWIFLGLIVGHTAMALFHHYVVQDGTLGKMIPILLRK